jgi:hypothetical protein
MSPDYPAPPRANTPEYMDLVAADIRRVHVGEFVESAPVLYAAKEIGGVAVRRAEGSGLSVEVEYASGERRVKRVKELLAKAKVKVTRDGWSTPIGSYALGFYPGWKVPRKFL